jgi:hypothetical protein
MGWTTMRTAWPPSTPAEDKYRNLCEKGLRTPDRAVPRPREQILPRSLVAIRSGTAFAKQRQPCLLMSRSSAASLMSAC